MRVVPAHAALGAAGLFVHVLLVAVRAAIALVPDPFRRVHPPILVRHAIAAHRVIKSRIHWRQHGRRQVGVAGVPVGIRQRRRKSGHRIGAKEVDKVLRGLVEPATAKRAARVREGEPLTFVGV